MAKKKTAKRKRRKAKANAEPKTVSTPLKQLAECKDLAIYSQGFGGTIDEAKRMRTVAESPAFVFRAMQFADPDIAGRLLLEGVGRRAGRTAAGKSSGKKLEAARSIFREEAERCGLQKRKPEGSELKALRYAVYKRLPEGTDRPSPSTCSRWLKKLRLGRFDA